MHSKPDLAAETIGLPVQLPIVLGAIQKADHLALASIGWGLTVITSLVIFVAIITTFAVSHA